MVRKEKIIKHYLKNQTKSLDELSKELDISKGWISSVITSYNKSLNIGKDIGFCFSLSLPNSLGYLFDDYREREVILEKNEILNEHEFTEYELLWLEKNYGLGKYLDTERDEIDYVSEAVIVLKNKLSQISPKERIKARKIITYLETI